MLGYVALGSVLTLAACSTPLSRSHDRPAAFKKLSPADQDLVLHGEVRKGLDQDAVYIAWGSPSWKKVAGSGKEGVETWIYTAQLSIYAPMGSYDQSTGFGFYGLEYPWAEPGFGFGDAQFRGFLDEPHVLPIYSRRKVARFVQGELVSFQSSRDGHAVPTECLP